MSSEPPPAIPPRTAISGVTVILGATLISGVASYLVTWLVPRQIGFAEYAPFAVFWSSIYLVVAALFGIQQEITRATRPLPPDAPLQRNRARAFGLAAGVVVLVVVLGTAPAWQGSVFPAQGWGLVIPLAVGASGFVMVATLCGSLYGVSAWRPLATLMVGDAVLRLVLIGVTLAFTHEVVALAWAVAIPFPATVALLWLYVRRHIVGRAQLDVGYGRVTWNVVRTISAAAANGAMVSGFPLLVGLTSAAASARDIGLVVLTATLVRAPLIIVSMSLQSYLVVHYRDQPHRLARTMLTYIAAALGGGVVLGLAGWALAPQVFAFLFPAQPVPAGWFVMLLVFSSALVAALCIAAPAVLARGRHVLYSVVWLTGAVVTIVGLLLPYDLLTRVLIAVIAGPVAALAVAAIYLLASSGPSRPAS